MKSQKIRPSDCFKLAKLNKVEVDVLFISVKHGNNYMASILLFYKCLPCDISNVNGQI